MGVMRDVVFVILYSIYFLLHPGYSQLIIGQVVEGSGSTKLISLINRGGAPENLTEYSLWIAYNLGDWRSVVNPLSIVTLGPGEEYVLCNTDFPAAFQNLCSAFEGELNFNGNDGISLKKQTLIVDQFGNSLGKGMQFGSSKTSFQVAGVDGASKDHTCVRKQWVVKGNTNWQLSAKDEWEVLPKDNVHLRNGSQIYLGGRAADAPGIETTKPTHVERKNGTILIGTLNTEFLFDGKGDTSISPYDGNVKEAEEHFQKIAQLVKRINPDIMNLCEVEDEAILNRLATGVGSGIRGYFVQGTDSATGQDVALLSKFSPGSMMRSNARADIPVSGSKCGRTPTRRASVSKNYVAEFKAKTVFPFKFAIVGAHLKAFPKDPKSCAQREGQAKVLQTVLRDLIGSGYEVMLMGDLNDFSDKTEDIANNQPRSRVLSMLRDPFNNGRDILKNVMEIMDKKDRYTAVYDKNRNKKVDSNKELSQIDHILMTQRLWGLVDNVFLDHSHDPFLISDHWPLLVEMRTNQQSVASVAKLCLATSYIFLTCTFLLI